MKKTNDKPDESGIVMKATNSINIIPFDPNNSMNVNAWLKYFNDKYQEYNLDDKWKLNNITAYLKNSALTEYVNSYDTIKTWEEFPSFLTERYISPKLVNLSDFTLKSFQEVFSKDKYDVGTLRVEPQRIVLNSDLPVSLRPYRTSPVEEQEIKSQVEKFLQAGLIRESNSPNSSPVTLAFKRDEGKKTRLCIDFRKLNALCKSDSEPLPFGLSNR
ncbi:hypothetical protein AVEN_101029-1 [Araneus ventricosus]|uniref:Uncharacterized protein n=1 Tax=Araneus ventricosus TaxID=182803 RepID=A0A4Y2KBJ9_ARAVE|nr:hypothetical protein AVEN_101029-1 [Araneus ventricosus]